MALLTTLSDWQNIISPYVNGFVIFFLIMFIGFLVGKIAGRLVYKFLNEVNIDSTVKKFTKTTIPLSLILSRTLAGIIYAVTTIIALNSVGVTTLLLEMIMIIVVIVLLISLFVALKDVIPNASAGIALRTQLKIGSKIKIDEIEGEIVELKLLETCVKTSNEDLIVIPNSIFAKKSVTIKGKTK